MSAVFNLNVTKRSGKKEPLDIDKIHKVVEEACRDIHNVSASLVEINSGLQFTDDISTDDIQNILIKSAADLISLDSPNYQYVAARLLIFSLVKRVFGDYKYPSISEVIKNNIEGGFYDKDVSSLYSTEELEKINSFIDHSRDLTFTYAGLRQVVDKYLVQDRISKKVFETPQFMYMMISLVIFSRYPKEVRLSYVRKYYDAISNFKINLPTPIIAGIRTPIHQFASCVLLDVDDSLPSIFSTATALGYYVARRAGIGLNLGRIRSIGSRIRGGEVEHTGVIPFLKVFEATVKSCTQNGIRGGSATVHFPIWHKEIEDIIVLKNNKGSDENRVRKLDYSIQISKIFYSRFLNDEEISLFSPHDVPGLYEAFGMPGFDELYLKYEKSKTPKKKIRARDLFVNILKERAETGRIYIMNIDHCNEHSSWTEQVTMSNLCQEITQPITPINHIDSEEGEIGTCILSALNVGILPVWGDKARSEITELCDLIIRSLDEIIDLQEYPVKAAERFTKKRRSLGVGYIGLAHYLAKNKMKYSDASALSLVHQLSEAFQYSLMNTSADLAIEKGPCEYVDKTKYSLGILPIDTYKKELDSLGAFEYNYDWEALRIKLKTTGIRNSTVSAQMPSESSSVVSNETNGIEPPRGYMSVKKSKQGTLKQIVPGYPNLKNNYTLLWDMKSNEGYINIVAIMQKFFDQAISGNWSYNPENYENNEVPMSVMVSDLITTYKLGWKTSYYSNTYDGKVDNDSNEIKMITADDVVKKVEEPENCDSCTI